MPLCLFRQDGQKSLSLTRWDIEQSNLLLQQEIYSYLYHLFINIYLNGNYQAHKAKNFHSIHYVKIIRLRLQTRYSLLDSLQYWTSCLAFSIARFNMHRACIPVEQRGLAASMSGYIFEIFSNKLQSSLHIERWT